MRRFFDRSAVSGAAVRPTDRAAAAAANRPLRTAPSIVDGQPVAVQSPARKRFGTADSAGGRTRSTPGRTDSTAVGSVTIRERSKRACRAAGKISLSSPTTVSSNSCRSPPQSPREALITTWQ